MKKLTLAPEKLRMRDIDGHVYKTYRIGNFLISENLKVEHYNDGIPIPFIENNKDWDCGKGAMCYYDNDKSNKEEYGSLYNFLAVDTGKLAPKGWHVPSDEEWDEINSFIDDNENVIESLCLKMGGRRYNGGSFGNLGSGGYWWSSTPGSCASAWSRGLSSSAGVGTSFTRNSNNRSGGFSVRCIRNMENEEIDLFDNSYAKNKSLARFGNDQLINELKRRGFRGELSKNTIFKL